MKEKNLKTQGHNSSFTLNLNKKLHDLLGVDVLRGRGRCVGEGQVGGAGVITGHR